MRLKILVLAMILLGFSEVSFAQITLEQAKEDHNLWFYWNGLHLVMGPEFTPREQNEVKRLIYSRNTHEIIRVDLGEGYVWWYEKVPPREDGFGEGWNLLPEGVEATHEELNKAISVSHYEDDFMAFETENIFSPPTVISIWARGESLFKAVGNIETALDSLQRDLAPLKVKFKTANLSGKFPLGFPNGWPLTYCGYVYFRDERVEIKGNFYASPLIPPEILKKYSR